MVVHLFKSVVNMFWQKTKGSFVCYIWNTKMEIAWVKSAYKNFTYVKFTRVAHIMFFFMSLMAHSSCLLLLWIWSFILTDWSFHGNLVFLRPTHLAFCGFGFGFFMIHPLSSPWKIGLSCPTHIYFCTFGLGLYNPSIHWVPYGK